jgi:hypothetical protein
MLTIGERKVCQYELPALDDRVIDLMHIHILWWNDWTAKLRSSAS